MHKIDTNDDGPMVTIEFEGAPLTVRSEETVAAALLAQNQWTFRTTPVSGAARGPFCMMGVCFECLVEIDGMANRQACMTVVRDGMRVKRQQGAGDIDLDPLPGVDDGDAP